MYGMNQHPGMGQPMGFAKCNICGTTEGLQRCGRCRNVYYCGVDHQRRDWDIHQKSCYYVPPVPQHMVQQAAYGYQQQPQQPQQSVVEEEIEGGSVGNAMQMGTPMGGVGNMQMGTPMGSVSRMEMGTPVQQHQMPPPPPNVGVSQIQQPHQPSEELQEADEPKANQTTLDGRKIYHDNSKPIEKDFSMANLPPSGSNVHMAAHQPTAAAMGVVGGNNLAAAAGSSAIAEAEAAANYAEAAAASSAEAAAAANHAAAAANDQLLAGATQPAGAEADENRQNLRRLRSPTSNAAGQTTAKRQRRVLQENVPRPPVTHEPSPFVDEEPTLQDDSYQATDIWDTTEAAPASMPPPPPPAPPVVEHQPEPEPEPEPEEEDDVEETTWETTLGILVLRGDKGYYGDGPANEFEWRTAHKWLLDVSQKYHHPLRRRGKSQPPYTEVWGKWRWNADVFGPNNEGRFKFRITDENFKGTWGWGNRTRGGGEWTGQRFMTAKELERESTAVADAEQEELDVQLCHAAVGGDHGVVPGLLEQGANPNNTVVESCTPVIHAVVMDHPKVVAALIENGRPGNLVDLNAQDQTGFTPLHISAEHGHAECARVILEHADAEKWAEEMLAGVPPEHTMAQVPEFFQVLACYALPVDLGIKDTDGRTILDITFSMTDMHNNQDLKENRRQIAQLVIARQKALKHCEAVLDGPLAMYAAEPEQEPEQQPEVVADEDLQHQAEAEEEPQLQQGEEQTTPVAVPENPEEEQQQLRNEPEEESPETEAQQEQLLLPENPVVGGELDEELEAGEPVLSEDGGEPVLGDDCDEPMLGDDGERVSDEQPCAADAAATAAVEQEHPLPSDGRAAPGHKMVEAVGGGSHQHDAAAAVEKVGPATVAVVGQEENGSKDEPTTVETFPPQEPAGGLY